MRIPEGSVEFSQFTAFRTSASVIVPYFISHYGGTEAAGVLPCVFLLSSANGSVLERIEGEHVTLDDLLRRVTTHLPSNQPTGRRRCVNIMSSL